MRFSLNKHKAAQAAAHLIKVHDGPINVMVLVKLLYLADRKALIETGSPITGDRMVSMPHGPVLSNIYDSINWPDNHWGEYISPRSGYDVSLIRPNPETDELSEYEIEILDEMHRDYGHFDWLAIRHFTHGLPEWEDPHGSSSDIDPVTILRSSGKSDAEIERLVAAAEEVYFLDQLISRSTADTR